MYSVEIHAPLGKRAAEVHKELGYKNIHTRIGDGYEGWLRALIPQAVVEHPTPPHGEYGHYGHRIDPARFVQRVIDFDQ